MRSARSFLICFLSTSITVSHVVSFAHPRRLCHNEYYQSFITSSVLYEKKNNWIGNNPYNKDWDLSDFWNALTNNVDDGSKEEKKDDANQVSEEKNTPRFQQERTRRRREEDKGENEIPTKQQEGVRGRKGSREGPQIRSRTPASLKRNRQQRRDDSDDYEECRRFREANNQEEKRRRHIEEQKQLEYDVNRYRTRCQILERAISEVKRNNTVLANRVQMLQHLTEKQKVSFIEKEEKWNKTEAKLKLDYQQDCVQLMDLLDQEKDLRLELDSENKHLIEKLKKSQEKLQEQKDLISKAEKHTSDNKFKGEIVKLTKEIGSLKNKLKDKEQMWETEMSALTNSSDTTIDSLEQKLKKMQRKLDVMTHKFDVREEIYKRTIFSTKNQTAIIERQLQERQVVENQQLKTIKNLKKNLQEEKMKQQELDKMIAALISNENKKLMDTNITNVGNDIITNQTQATSDEQDRSQKKSASIHDKKYQESMQIAKASVKAAKNRENHWKEQTKILQKKVDTLQNENKKLKELKLLLDEKIDLQEQTLLQKYERIYQEKDSLIQEFKRENEKLNQSFEDEREMLKNDLLSSNKIWERRITILQNEYEKKIFFLRNEMNTNGTDKRVRTPSDDADDFNDVIVLDYLDELDVANGSNKIFKKGKLKKFFSYIRRPFRRKK